MSLNERVLAGKKFLDTVVPNWEQHINLENLDIQWGDCCIIGQLFEQPDVKELLVNALNEYSGGKNWTWPSVANLGLYMDGTWGSFRDYPQLTKCWKQHIFYKTINPTQEGGY